MAGSKETLSANQRLKLAYSANERPGHWTVTSSVSGPGEGGPLSQKLLSTPAPLPGADPKFLKIFIRFYSHKLFFYLSSFQPSHDGGPSPDH